MSDKKWSEKHGGNLIAVARRRARVCARCGHTQIVPPSLQTQTVFCDCCVAEIPPQR